MIKWDKRPTAMKTNTGINKENVMAHLPLRVKFKMIKNHILENVFRELNIYLLWRQLRSSIDTLELEISRTTLPRPTLRMCEFLILAEDRRYSQHPGVDAFALCRAVWKTKFCGSRQGGSTIAMQLVRVLTGRYERTWLRKATEIYLAILLSRYISRDRLPVLYLWCAYYGWKMNNFRQACSRLKIDPTCTSELDDARLVARLKYPQPSRYDSARMQKIHQRGLHILKLAEVRKTSYSNYLREFQNETI